MKILVACEESQAVTIEFRKLGHEAYSCDIQESSGGHPEWHMQHDVIELLEPGKNDIQGVEMEDGSKVKLPRRWDMIIAFPPCTHLAVSGARHFEVKRLDGRQLEDIELFMGILGADCDKIAIENPVNIIGGDYIPKHFPKLLKKYDFRKKDQIIQPYEYGDEARKRTCLWLKGLQKLESTKIVGEGKIDRNGHSYGASAAYATDENGKILSWNDPRTAKIRSKTFPGIAKAMAEQWGGQL